MSVRQYVRTGTTPTNIRFPMWVRTTLCEGYTQSALIPTPHGMIRREYKIRIDNHPIGLKRKL